MSVPLSRHGAAGGFTLLEILLVLVIVALASTMIAPSFDALLRPSPRTEARRLAIALRMAEDEVSLNGLPMLWYASRHAYGFAQSDGKGGWVTLADPPFGRRLLPAGLAVLSVRPTYALADIPDSLVRSSPGPVLALVLLMPSRGVYAPVKIAIGADGGDAARISLRPWHGGIRLLQAGG